MQALEMDSAEQPGGGKRVRSEKSSAGCSSPNASLMPKPKRPMTPCDPESSFSADSFCVRWVCCRPRLGGAGGVRTKRSKVREAAGRTPVVADSTDAVGVRRHLDALGRGAGRGFPVAAALLHRALGTLRQDGFVQRVGDELADGVSLLPNVQHLRRRRAESEDGEKRGDVHGNRKRRVELSQCSGRTVLRGLRPPPWPAQDALAS